MTRRGWIGSLILFVALAAIGAGLATWKQAEMHAGSAPGAQHEPMEVIAAATAEERMHVRTTTTIGTVHALQSVRLRNEISGTVRDVHLTSGEIVDEGKLLVAFDVAVESAELQAQEAQVALAETLLGRVQRALEKGGASEVDVDRARAERDVARANVARTRAVIDRKTIRAPFRARVGLSDVHVGQYLNEGTELTTLQGIDDAVHIDFAVAQAVAAGLQEGAVIEVAASDAAPAQQAAIVAIDARVDAATRNAWVRARLEGAAGQMSPGASVRVRVPVGAPRPLVAVPVSALRRGPAGDHVFVLSADDHGAFRAHVRPVKSGAVLGDVVLIEEGLAAGEQVAASGSFKLREGVLVAVAETPPTK